MGRGGGGGEQFSDGGLVVRLATALRRMLEEAPAFDQLQAGRDELMQWESARYRAVKQHGWKMLEDVGGAGA